MRKVVYSFLVMAFLFTMCGCETNKTRVGEGAGIGAAIGAIAGGVIGNQVGSPVGGALIGGALGAAGGAAVGAQINKPGTAQVGSNQPMAQLSMGEVVELTKQGVASESIIARIRATHSTYSLTQDDISYLRGQRVSQRVIEEMLAAK